MEGGTNGQTASGAAGSLSVLFFGGCEGVVV